ncbi:MAG: disulfide bond formation protein B [Candidatus Electrothrix sp. ATG2]|nr:disulfide bond formation protein B [Candidatus Electrothrix sp. ATG2]
MLNSDQTSHSNWTILFLCWLIACISALGSLFFSEIMNFAPCVLCWYERVCMYPLVLILSMGLFSFDKSVIRFSLPLALIGWFVTLYHNLLYSGIIPESIQPCSQGVSCTEEYIDLFGVFSIPMLALISFSVITTLLFILKRRFSK